MTSVSMILSSKTGPRREEVAEEPGVGEDGEAASAQEAEDAVFEAPSNEVESRSEEEQEEWEVILG